MAKDADKNKDEGEGKAAAKPRRGKKLLIIVLIIVLLVVLVAGGLLALLLAKRGGGEDGEEAAVAVAPRVDLSRPPAVVTLEAFTVNLAPDEGPRFLQVVMVLRVVDARTGENLKGFMPQIRHSINLLLSSKLPSELATSSGRELLAQEITDEINKVLGTAPGQEGPIQGVFFNSFIIQ